MDVSRPWNAPDSGFSDSDLGFNRPQEVVGCQPSGH
jgi:hypothetical protein